MCHRRGFTDASLTCRDSERLVTALGWQLRVRKPSTIVRTLTEGEVGQRDQDHDLRRLFSGFSRKIPADAAYITRANVAFHENLQNLANFLLMNSVII